MPKDYQSFGKTLKTGDILFIKGNDGSITHSGLWLGDIGKSTDKLLLILDSTGDSGVDSNGNRIPDGIYLRAFRPTSFALNRPVTRFESSQMTLLKQLKLARYGL